MPALLYAHLSAGNCHVQKSLHIIGKTRFGVSSSPTYLLPILLSPSYNGWLRFIQIRSSAARRNISKVCSPTLNDTIRPAWLRLTARFRWLRPHHGF
jgi:hypothetical protein